MVGARALNPTPPHDRRVPSVADVDVIGACPHPILRNLRITQTYHELSFAVADAVVPGANWCTFATWASKQAGQTIRGDDLGRKIADVFAESDGVQLVVARLRHLRHALGRRIDGDTVLRAIRDACAPLSIVARVADAIARGNKKVFDEIGREFARFLEVTTSAGLDPGAVDSFCERLRPGEPPNGQRLLAAAFRGYSRARALTERPRIERMLLANLQIGLHEQMRLQPEIEEALNACVPDPQALKRRLVDALLPDADSRIRGRLAGADGAGGVLDEVSARLIDRMRAKIRGVVTAELMTLTLPGGALRLGRDVTETFPMSITPPADPELTEFLRSVDPTPDTALGSGAEDWAELFDRMHFIADLFRTRQEDTSLFQPPFSRDQLRAIADDRTPGGDL